MNGVKRTGAAGFRIRPAHLLPLGAVLGLCLAASGAFTPRAAAPMKDAAAFVNGVPIKQADRERVIEALAAGKRNPLDTEDKKFALSRLIDEELLIQRSIELGLQRTDAVARKRLVTAMLEWIAADAAAPVSDRDLQAFYRQNSALFTPTARADVAWFHIARSEPDGAARANEAANRLKNGLSFDEVAAAAASPASVTVPQGMLPPAKLRDYLGPSLTREALALTPGEPAGPFPRTDGWHFLLLRAREAGKVPAFKEIRVGVTAAYAKRREDEAVRAYLDWLRRRADIAIPPDVRP